MFNINSITKVKESTVHGKGCFAKKDIPKGTLVFSNVIIFEADKESNHTLKQLMKYIFAWSRNNNLRNICICSSNASFINSSTPLNIYPNIKIYKLNFTKQIKIFKIVQDIEKDSELFLEY